METLADRLKALELELHQPEVRRNAERLDVLLHDAFMEIGSSGTVHHKADTLARMLAEQGTLTIHSDGFEVSELVPGVMLMTYQAVIGDQQSGAGRRSLRSSLWLHTTRGWQMRFHQGTPLPGGD